MRSDFTADIVLRALSNLWDARLPRLAEYLDETFGYSLKGPFEPIQLILLQMADGDVATCNIGNDFQSQWILSGGVLEPVPIRRVHQELFKLDASRELYLSPSFAFCYDGAAMILSEKYGPGLIHRLCGQLTGDDQDPMIAWMTAWRFTDSREQFLNNRSMLQAISNWRKSLERHQP